MSNIDVTEPPVSIILIGLERKRLQLLADLNNLKPRYGLSRLIESTECGRSPHCHIWSANISNNLKSNIANSIFYPAVAWFAFASVVSQWYSCRLNLWFSNEKPARHVVSFASLAFTWLCFYFLNFFDFFGFFWSLWSLFSLVVWNRDVRPLNSVQCFVNQLNFSFGFSRLALKISFQFHFDSHFTEPFLTEISTKIDSVVVNHP